jgi:hypothetical protein
LIALALDDYELDITGARCCSWNSHSDAGSGVAGDRSDALQTHLPVLPESPSYRHVSLIGQNLREVSSVVRIVRLNKVRLVLRARLGQVGGIRIVLIAVSISSSARKRRPFHLHLIVIEHHEKVIIDHSVDY